MKNLELKIYEKLGVRKFRNIAVKFAFFFLHPKYIFSKNNRKKAINKFHNTPSNYFIDKDAGLKGLKDFNQWIYIHSFIHIYALLHCVAGLFSTFTVIAIPFTIANLYCLMLQRYNYIRINNVIKKHEEFEKKKISNIKNEIKENINKPNISIYSSKKKINENDKTIDSMLENLSLKNLKKLKKLIEINQIYNNKFLYTTFEEENKSYELGAKVKQKNRSNFIYFFGINLSVLGLLSSVAFELFKFFIAFSFIES